MAMSSTLQAAKVRGVCVCLALQACVPPRVCVCCLRARLTLPLCNCRRCCFGSQACRTIALQLPWTALLLLLLLLQ